MRCPYCGFLESKVIDSRESQKGMSIRRRRECLSCKKRFTTYERLEQLPYMVVKKDGTRQPFDSQKLLRGMMKACEKRPIQISQLEEIVEEIESILQDRPDKEMESSEIGQIVMERLKALDKVAYIRFASVYREFKDVVEFKHVLENLLKEK
ncbi:MAG: transcriptional regulator NrdR [Candidatus Saccharicenans sp.]|jgi:transcriptional repressor NrdR|uniref:Transcriptional repressor NrdR n=1 Tax=Candidatus Saccharicenans subterraneus TaxID=2508984 RepID=A0A3E2BKF5_9BACT|nr:transcriptional regulator NrdR [Candidatus Saccharicenans sp.]MCX8160006.1 transcriptional regulator NrdR [Candidatus Saccharicenans sp.]MDH7575601.1 transcriptional regulator NrdR [Candidatus Saccharicenans sp.]NPV83031.1 transcriptional regulator NrdR [Candidatus Aminicenantes bacterium]RFT15223.1 MAG: Ribonucleotide reductase transcriptional regulator NrdR [Candidatus Saccharicenans subterraneum]